MFKNIMLIFLIALCLVAPVFGITAILTVVMISRIIARSAKGSPTLRKS